MINYNNQLRAALLGRRYKEAHTSGSGVISFMGEALGFQEGDVHVTRFYRIFLTLNQTDIITEVRTVVDGELISPCSGYFPEVLDEFDFDAVKNLCLDKTEGIKKRERCSVSSPSVPPLSQYCLVIM